MRNCRSAHNPGQIAPGEHDAQRHEQEGFENVAGKNAGVEPLIQTAEILEGETESLEKARVEVLLEQVRQVHKVDDGNEQDADQHHNHDGDLIGLAFEVPIAEHGGQGNQGVQKC